MVLERPMAMILPYLCTWTLEKLQKAHQGCTQIHLRAQLSVFWSKISHEMDQVVEKGEVYLWYRPSKTEVWPNLQAEPAGLMHHVAMDLAPVEQTTPLSGHRLLQQLYLDCFPCRSDTPSSDRRPQLVFRCFGYHQIWSQMEGPNLVSHEMITFCWSKDLQIIVSSFYHPSSNVKVDSV